MIKKYNTRKTTKFKYKDGLGLEKTSQQQANDTIETPYDQVKHCQERKKMNAAVAITSAAGAVEFMQVIEPILKLHSPVKSAFRRITV